VLTITLLNKGGTVMKGVPSSGLAELSTEIRDRLKEGHDRKRRKNVNKRDRRE